MKFLSQVQSEITKVIWPKKDLTAMYTVAVIIISLFVAYYLNLFDFIFTNYGLRSLIN